MKKRLFAWALVTAMLLPAAGCSAPGGGQTAAPGRESPTGAADGTYTATKSGYGGDLTVTTTISGGKVTGVTLGDNRESLVVIERALPLLQERILAAGTADVDTVTGATFSSFAIKSAVAEAMGQAGMEVPQFNMHDQSEYPETVLDDITVDLLIIGGGPSGLAAAIAAKETDPSLQVLVVEKLDILSGNGKFDLNFYDVFNSEAQKAAGVEDSREQFMADMADAGEAPQRLLVWAQGEENVDAWLRSFGVTLDYYYGSRNHMATKDDYAGQMIQREMERYVRELGAEVRTGTAGLDLVFEGDRVSGATVKTNHNELYNIYAKKTIVATGGFSWNQDLLAKYAPDYVDYNSSNQMGAQGDFVPVFEKYGFRLENMGKIRMIPLILLPSRDLTNSGKGTVLVNQDGKRFVNERASELALAGPIREQAKVWMIVDSQKVTDHANVRKQVKEGRFREAATLEEAASIIGCDPQALLETFRVYNEHAENQTEDQFGLTPERSILPEGPYYVSQASSAVHMTKGGVACNEKAQVLYEDGTVVEDLYASGEVTWQSGGYSQSVVFGRVAGEEAARAIRDSRA